MEQLKAAFEDVGIVVPNTHNEKGLHEVSWSTDYQDVGGAVDIYAMDTYPAKFHCEDPDVGFKYPESTTNGSQTSRLPNPGILLSSKAVGSLPREGHFTITANQNSHPSLRTFITKAISDPGLYFRVFIWFLAVPTGAIVPLQLCILAMTTVRPFVRRERFEINLSKRSFSVYLLVSLEIS